MDEEKKPRRRRGRKPEEETAQEEQVSDVEILAHNITAMGIAQLKLLQAIYAEQRAYSFFLLSEQIGGSNEGVRLFQEARQLQDQSKDLVRAAWNDVFGSQEDAPQEEPDGETEVQEG